MAVLQFIADFQDLFDDQGERDILFEFSVCRFNTFASRLHLRESQRRTSFRAGTF